MIINRVTDAKFAKYGCILDGLNLDELMALAKTTPLPASGTINHDCSYPEFEKLAVCAEIRDKVFGGLPIQMDYCNGHNTKLNGLEYHKSAEVMIYLTDAFLLLGSFFDIRDNTYDTSKVELFLAPAGTAVETWATTLHYYPCNAHKGQPFQSVCILPKRTNTEKPSITPTRKEDQLLFGFNKWFMAHPDSPEARNGAHVGLIGENLDVASILD
jgi:hypothetical protein